MNAVVITSNKTWLIPDNYESFTSSTFPRAPSPFSANKGSHSAACALGADSSAGLVSVTSALMKDYFKGKKESLIIFVEKRPVKPYRIKTDFIRIWCNCYLFRESSARSLVYLSEPSLSSTNVKTKYDSEPGRWYASSRASPELCVHMVSIFRLQHTLQSHTHGLTRKVLVITWIKRIYLQFTHSKIRNELI